MEKYNYLEEMVKDTNSKENEITTMKTIEQIKSELQERTIDVIDIEIWHFDGMPNDIRLTINGCLTINNLVIIAGYFGGTPYVHSGEEILIVGIVDLNKQTEGL